MKIRHLVMDESTHYVNVEESGRTISILTEHGTADEVRMASVFELEKAQRHAHRAEFMRQVAAAMDAEEGKPK